MDLEFRPLLEQVLIIGESPIYDEERDRLLYCDHHGWAVYSVQLDGTELQTWKFPSTVGCLGITRSRRLVIALGSEVGILDRDTGEYSLLAHIDLPPNCRLNDGRVGPDGAFWVGALNDEPVRRPVASLYRIDGRGKVEEKVTGLTLSNGLAFSPDGTVMYLADTTDWIDRWDFDKATGRISNRRRFVDLDDTTGKPDGAVVDAEGHYWIAGLRAARLNRFSPDGRLVDIVPVPAAVPTMPCFAGKDRRTLVVTSVSKIPPELLERRPLTGMTFIATTPAPVAGIAEFLFDDLG